MIMVFILKWFKSNSNGVQSSGSSVAIDFPISRSWKILAKVSRLRLDSPSLEELYADECDLKELVLNCPSLWMLRCSENYLELVDLQCPVLSIFSCTDTCLTKLELDCPELRECTVEGTH